MELIFENPEYLLFLVSVPVLIVVHLLSLRFLKRKALIFSNFQAVARVLGSGQDLSMNTLPVLLRSFVFILLALAVSGLVLQEDVLRTDYDFVLAIDSSSSMGVGDIAPSRFEAAKEASRQFINSLGDVETRTGIVKFGGIASNVASPTLDKERLSEALQSLEISQTGGTAIGDAITLSSNLLLDSERQRSIILITDGQSNVGISPLDALNNSVENEIIINSMGIGSEGGAFSGNLTIGRLDEETLITLAEASGGQYFKINSRADISDAFSQLSSASIAKQKTDIAPYLLLVSLLILIIEWLAINTKYRTIP
jgi:Ca-activated chloride channel family protein